MIQCLLLRYALGEFPDVYVPTVFDQYAYGDLHLGGHCLNLFGVFSLDNILEQPMKNRACLRFAFVYALLLLLKI